MVAKKCVHLNKFVSITRHQSFSKEDLNNFGQYSGERLEMIRFDNLKVDEMIELLKPMKSLRAIHFNDNSSSAKESFHETL